MKSEKILEKDIESYLREEVKKVGGNAYKFNSPENAGVPDRIVLLPRSRIVFIELKAPGAVPRPLQKVQISKIKKFGFPVLVIDSKEKVDLFIQNTKYWNMDKLSKGLGG